MATEIGEDGGMLKGGADLIELRLRPLVVDCIPSDSLVCQVNAHDDARRSFWDAWLWAEMRRMDREIFSGPASEGQNS